MIKQAKKYIAIAVILLFGICFTNIVEAEETTSWVTKESFEERYLGLNEDNLSGMYLEYAENRITKEELRHAIGFKIKKTKDRFLEVSDSNKELKEWRARKLDFWQTNGDAINKHIINVKASKIDENKEKEKIKEVVIKGIISKYGWLQEIARYKEVIKEHKIEINKKRQLPQSNNDN